MCYVHTEYIVCATCSIRFKSLIACNNCSKAFLGWFIEDYCKLVQSSSIKLSICRQCEGEQQEQNDSEEYGPAAIEEEVFGAELTRSENPIRLLLMDESVQEAVEESMAEWPEEPVEEVMGESAKESTDESAEELVEESAVKSISVNF